MNINYLKRATIIFFQLWIFYIHLQLLIGAIFLIFQTLMIPDIELPLYLDNETNRARDSVAGAG